jgi:hypothetical protein
MFSPKTVIIVVIVLAILAVVTAGTTYFYIKYQKAQKEVQTIKSDPNNVQKAVKEEARKTIEEVGKLVELPQGEEPTVVAITDIDKLKNQPFFANAKNGDRVIIYTIAKKAIIYDPATKKIIEVGPVNIGTPSAQQLPQQSPI